MVEELFSAMQNRNVEESYYDFALEQINNGLIRDLYMGSIAEAFEGFEQEPSEIMQEAEQLDDFMMEGISTEELVDEAGLFDNLKNTANGFMNRYGRESSRQSAAKAIHDYRNPKQAFARDAINLATTGAVAYGLYKHGKKAGEKEAGNQQQAHEGYGQLDDFMMEGQGCANCCTDPAIVRAIDLLPESDPRDAGTFFSRTNAVNAEECGACCQEQFDLIDAIIPDTVISL